MLRDLGPDIQWVQSYVTDDKITCVYLAASEEIIREHGRCGGFPSGHSARSPQHHRPDHRGGGRMSRAAISLTTGLEDPEKVTVALLVAVGAAEGGRDSLMFLTKEAVRLATDGVAQGVACEGCPPIPDLMRRFEAAGGQLLVCPICFNARSWPRPSSCPTPGWAEPSSCGSGSVMVRPPSATDGSTTQRKEPAWKRVG